MTEKITKLTENWLLCEGEADGEGWRGLISLNHTNAILKARKPHATEFFLADDRAPIHVDLPLDDVIAIVTGPPQTQSTVATMNYGIGELVTAEITEHTSKGNAK